MNHKCETRKKLLNSDGSLAEPGWSNHLIFDYSPFDIKANKMRIKEWDYYVIVDDDFAFATVIDDNRYMGLLNSSFYDFKENKKYDFIEALIMPMGSLNMPVDSSNGDIYQKRKNVDIAYTHVDGGRRLTGKYKKTSQHGELEYDLFFKSFPEDDTMVIATPWAEDKKAFYYNQKINCMPASGYIKFNGRTINITPDRHFATLDWGRGVWTYDNTWFWGSGNGYVNGKRFGYNIGYGFGDTTAASENMIFYDGKCHKLDRLRFDIPDDIMKPWKIVSTDGRFDMDFFPVYDNRTYINAVVMGQDAHQVFGKIKGKAVLDDGTVLDIDNLTVFNERVRNRY